MTHNELKRLAIEKLKEQGIGLDPKAKMRDICAAFGVHTFHGKTERWHIERWLGLAPEPVEKPRGITAPPPYRRESFGQLSWRPARMDEVNRDQPPFHGAMR